MFNFTENIKEVIDEIKRGKGIPIKKMSPDDELVLYLKAHLINSIREEGKISRHLSSWISLELNEGFFEEGIRKCLFFLDELNIHEDEEINYVLKKVIEERYIQSRINEKGNYRKDVEFLDFIVTCTANSWGEYATDKTLTYDYCKQRFLIIWDYRNNCWEVSGLGEIFLDFTPLKAVIFLLSIDLTSSSSEYDREYFSEVALNELLKFKKKKKSERGYYGGRIFNNLNINTLRKLGVIKGRSPREIVLTPLGEIAVKEALKEDNPMLEMINTIVQSEEQGVSFEGAASETEELSKLLERNELTESIASSIKNGLKLFNERKYLDAVKLFYPAIEGLTNEMLIKEGEEANNHRKFPGLAKKLNKLEDLNVLPPDLTNSINVTFSRNKILHGEYQPTDEEYVYPLCISCIVFLKRMIKEKK